MVHFPGLARTHLYIQRAVCRFYRHGFPHSEIPGSKPACGSPRLIAASHVLHRLLAPRHPPYALSSLTIKLTRHVAPALAFSRKFFCADNSPFHNSLSRAELADYTRHNSPRLKSGRIAPRFASFFSCQRASALGTPRAFRARRNVRKLFEPKIKNPASSAGPIRLHIRAQAASRDARLNYPVFVTSLTSSPERARQNASSPDSRISRTG